jgi:hypothetical protein
MAVLTPPVPVSEPSGVEAPDAGVIEDARRRHRRHRLVGAVIAIAALLAAVAAYFGAGGVSSPGPRTANGGALTTAAAAAVFSQDPDLGVACHVPNWIGCDRVGLAVWLRRPAISVRATIAGAPLKLDNHRWSGPLHNGRRTMFAGFLQPAGLTHRLHVRPEPGTETWLGSGQPTPTVQFRIDYGYGRIVLTHENVGLAAGWG